MILLTGREVSSACREAWRGDASVDEFRITARRELIIGLNVEAALHRSLERVVDLMSIELALFTWCHEILRGFMKLFPAGRDSTALTGVANLIDKMPITEHPVCISKAPSPPLFLMTTCH